MVAACKPAGAVVFEGNTNEAVRQRNQGLHQWNFMPVENGDMMLWQMDKTAISLRHALGNKILVQARGDRWYRVEITYHGCWWIFDPVAPPTRSISSLLCAVPTTFIPADWNRSAMGIITRAHLERAKNAFGQHRHTKRQTLASEQTSSNVRNISMISIGWKSHASFGTRGSQVQILPIWPTLSRISNCHRHRLRHRFVPPLIKRWSEEA
jgi:hypothetical protein